MRTSNGKSVARFGRGQDFSHEKRHQKTAVASSHLVKRQGFLAGEEFDDWRDAAAEIEHLPEPRVGDESKTSSAKLDFLQELEGQLNECDEMIENLKVKARDARAEIRAEFAVQLEALAGDRALALEKLQELRRHGEWAWEDLRDSAERTWSELRAAIERSASNFE